MVLLALANCDTKVVGFDQGLGGLLEIDDVDPTALAEDIRAHFGVPAAALGAKVHARFDELLNRYNCHFHTPTPLHGSELRYVSKEKRPKTV